MSQEKSVFPVVALQDNYSKLRMGSKFQWEGLASVPLVAKNKIAT